MRIKEKLNLLFIGLLLSLSFNSFSQITLKSPNTESVLYLGKGENQPLIVGSGGSDLTPNADHESNPILSCSKALAKWAKFLKQNSLKYCSKEKIIVIQENSKVDISFDRNNTIDIYCMAFNSFKTLTRRLSKYDN